jgi:glycosyltransferase involved in cell wall biosynthesis
VGVSAGAMVDRVAHGVDGFLVAPESPEAMAECILRTPRDDWRVMGDRARRKVETEFSWSRTFETLLGLYRRALNRR